jgi:glycosyltransferase involved in cell wall biosynthesis
VPVKPLRILVASTVYKATPPSGYGGIERVVHQLVEELVRQGHDVTLFGAKRSHCSGRTIAVTGGDPERAPSTISKRIPALSEEAMYRAMCEYTAEQPVDVIHDWSFQNLFVRRHPERIPFVTSTCVPPATEDVRPNLVACSRAHALQCGGTTRFVHYGLPLDDWEYSEDKGERLVHIAKIARYKGQHLAIRAARRAGRRLLLAGNVEDPLYHHAVVRPWLRLSPGVEHVGEIDGTHELLLDAAALVQTPRWFEAFPLVVLEALASATPVIALDRGGIREQIVHGETGFLCRDLSELTEAFERVRELKPASCRAQAEDRFSIGRMAESYLELYGRVLDGERW